MAQVLGKLPVQRCLQDRLGQLLQQLARPGQRKALLRARWTVSALPWEVREFAISEGATCIGWPGVG